VHSDADYCHNCGIRLNGRFCSACGQKARPLNVGVRDFFHDFIEDALNVDGRTFQTVRRLILSPGLLTREYLQGHRARWVSPIRLYLTFSVMFFALSAVVPYRVGVFEQARRESGWSFSWETGPRAGVASTETENADDEARKLGYRNADELQQTIGRALAVWLPRVMFVLLPFFAWLVALAYRRVDSNYLHHLMFALHVHAAYFAIAALATVAQAISPMVGGLLRVVATVYTFAYVLLAFRRVYGQVRLRLLRIAFVVSIYWVGVIVAIVTIVVPYILPAIVSGNPK
jgi:hypothetical protein